MSTENEIKNNTPELTPEQKREQEMRRLEALYGPKQPGTERETVIIEEETAPMIDTAETASTQIIIDEDEEEDLDEHMVTTGSESPATRPAAGPAPQPKEKKEYEEDCEPEVDSGLGVAALNLLLVLSPLMIPFYCTILLFEITAMNMVAFSSRITFSLISLGLCMLLPLLLFLGLKKLRLITDLQLMNRKERTIPYAIMALAIGGLALFYALAGAPVWLWAIFVGGAAAALVNMLINFKIRICSSATGLASLVAALVVMQNYTMEPAPVFWWTLGCVLLAGLVGTASIMVRRHSLLEVICGYATGFLAVILFSLI